MESEMKELELDISQNENGKAKSHPADPASPAVPVQVENVTATSSTTEADDEKIILTLESLHYSTESADYAKKNEENQRALEKLDKLLQTNSITKKKIVKTGNGEKSSSLSVVTVKTVSGGEKKAPRILNASLAKSPNPESSMRLLNSIGIPSEEDLLAILEGSSQDEETEVDVKVIDDAAFGKKKTMTTVLLSKNQELKIAADQMKEISKKGALLKPNAGSSSDTNEVTTDTNELINSIALEWSDTEREMSEEIAELKSMQKPLKQNVIKRKEPKVVIVSASGDSNESEKTIENIDIKVEKPEQTTGIAPYKRSRIIKKKIIWDPDAPETQFSYASLIKPKAKPTINKKPVQKETNENSIKSETKLVTKRVVAEKKAPAANRKRKDISPDKVNEKLEEALNEILSEEMTSTAEEKPKISGTSIKGKEAPPAKKPRITKAKQAAAGSSSWDYINKGRSDEMMIIRRRSSSYSSTTSQRRMSFEQHQKQITTPHKSIRVIRKLTPTEQLKTAPGKKRKQEIQLKKVTATKQTINNQQNSIKVIPVIKKLSIADTKKLAPPSPTMQTSVANKKINRQILSQNLEKTVVSSTNVSSTNLKPQKVVEKKSTKVSDEKPKSDMEIILKKLNSVVNFIIDLKIENPAHTLNLDSIKKFVSTLEHLKQDNSCKIVVVTSKGTHFCHGIDFSCLIASTIEKRKAIAIELAKYIKLLFETLINFNKPIIAAVGGLVSNLGVTMLPLFDVVFASDKCAFEMTYSKIGQIPEGNCILNTLNMDKKFKLKLIYLAEKLTANEALSAGLLTAVYPSQRFEAEAINVATKMSSLSQQTYKSLKQIRMQKFANDGFVKALEEEQDYLTGHWISSECQERFKELLQK